MKDKIELLYLVNVHIPNDRANGVQIAHTCEELGKHTNLTLATREVRGETGDVTARYGIEHTFTHIRLLCVDMPGLPLRYFVRNVTFFISANAYALGFFLKHLVSGKKAAMYVRGEVILALIPLSIFFPIFFETHQIRNFAWLYRVALRFTKGIIVVTDRLKQKFIEEYKLPAHKIFVARDAVDLQSYSGVSRERALWEQYGIPAGKQVVLYAGTLAPEKGAHTLAEAAASLPDGVYVVFLGGTDSQVETFRAQYGHVRNSVIVGRVPHTEVPRYIVSADALILPDSAQYTYSNLYTSPMKLFEYMASSRPIIASDVPSLREVLDSETAFFFEPDSPLALAETIREVLENPNEAHARGQKAYVRVSAYTWEERGKKIYHHVTGLLKMEYY